jgi:hypothetical protein
MGALGSAIRLGFSAVSIVCLGVLALAGPAEASNPTAALKAKALSISNLPSGWAVDNSTQASDSGLGGCFKALEAIPKPKGLVRADLRFNQNGDTPSIEEILETGKGAAARYAKFLHVMSGCTTVNGTVSGTKVTGSVGAMSFPSVGADSQQAYAVKLSAGGESVVIDALYFRVGKVDGSFTYEDFSPDADTVQAFATAAVDKIQGKPVTTPTDAF